MYNIKIYGHKYTLSLKKNYHFFIFHNTSRNNKLFVNLLHKQLDFNNKFGR